MQACWALQQHAAPCLTCTLRQVNYRESISRAADIHYTHKKQSGGAGQYADISVKFEPGEPGSGFTFRSDIKGGAVSLPCLQPLYPGDLDTEGQMGCTGQALATFGCKGNPAPFSTCGAARLQASSMA